MRQIAKTSSIIARLNEAGAAVDNVTVFEAIALNTLPLRQRHPIYNGAVASRSLLLELALALSAESRPVHAQHDSSDLPIGRVFYGEVIDDELRVLFWIDDEHKDKASLINNGTVDQVSVGILPKHMICSVDGFDFLSPDASLEHIFTGTTPDGHTIGENGAFCRMVGLEAFFEMSIVNQGGAQNARIVNQEQSHFSDHIQKLAASVSFDKLALAATATPKTENSPMDLKELLAELRVSEKESTKLAIENEQLKASTASLTTERDALKASLEEAEKADPDLAALKASHDVADKTLRDICKKVLVAAGQVDAEVPAELAAVVAKLTDTSEGLAAVLVAGGKSKGSEGDLKTEVQPAVGAFRARR